MTPFDSLALVIGPFGEILRLYIVQFSMFQGE
jgi:hypothetical protein